MTIINQKLKTYIKANANRYSNGIQLQKHQNEDFFYHLCFCPWNRHGQICQERSQGTPFYWLLKEQEKNLETSKFKFLK